MKSLNTIVIFLTKSHYLANERGSLQNSMILSSIVLSV